MINVKGLTKRFGNTVAVRDVTFSVPAGQVLGFLGPNGAGKSTTMRILTGYITADDGVGSIAGFDIFTQSLEVRKRIGYLPESAPLYLDMDVPDFLKFIVTVRKIPRHKHRESIDRMIDLCGLKTVMHKKIGELSKGFRQRVGLAQTMIHDPDILVLDEPTSGLDPNQIVEIRDLIREIGKQKTIILSTHILQEVTATCDRIVIINEGRLVADGSPDDLAAQSSGDTIFWVTVKAPPEEARILLSQLPGVIDVRLQTEASDRSRFSLKFRIPDQIEERIFQSISQKGWILTELHRETASLEDVFARLTAS